MASKRQQIINAFTSCLNASTSIAYVSDDMESWFDLQDDEFPACLVLDGPTEIERMAYPSTAYEDMEATMQVSVLCYVRSLAGSTGLPAKYYDLLEDVEQAVEASTTLDTLATDWMAVGIDPDDATQETYRSAEVRFTVTYNYVHNAP